MGAGPQRKLASVWVDRRLATPLFRQVYQRIREAILDGTLPPGASLPSTRSLAGQLSTARGTIELAYALLVGEGRDAVMIEAETALAKLRAISKRSAFNQWLGLEVTAASEGSAELQLGFSTPDSLGRLSIRRAALRLRLLQWVFWHLITP